MDSAASCRSLIIPVQRVETAWDRKKSPRSAAAADRGDGKFIVVILRSISWRRNPGSYRDGGADGPRLGAPVGAPARG
jgi:hypothetical protein